MNIHKKRQQGHADNVFPFSLILFMFIGWGIWSLSSIYSDHKYYYSDKIYQVLDIEQLDWPQDLKINAFKKIANKEHFQFQEDGKTATISFSLNHDKCENTLNGLFQNKKHSPIDLIINQNELIFKEALNDTQIMAICNEENTFTQPIHFDTASFSSPKNITENKKH